MLENSDYEGDDFDDGDASDDDFTPLVEEVVSSESETDEDEPLLAPALRPVRGRGQSSRGRGHGSRSRSRIERSTDSSRPVDQAAEWLPKDFNPLIPQLSEPSYPPIDSKDFTSIDYFQQYFDDAIIQLITEKSNQTSVENTGRSLNLTESECKKFIAITMMMSCLNFPYLRMYWENRWRVPMITTAMARNRFFQLRSSLKVVFDNDVSREQRASDKLWKVRPIIEKMQIGCHKQVRQQHISIDEMIMPFSGSCGIKQYCPNKPNPVGLKLFVLANPDGTVCDFTVYQGKTTYPEENAAGFGLGESAVINLTRTLVPGHILYYDRYFTSIKLATELNARGFKCVGTIMKNRIPAALRNALPGDLEMKRRGRGEDSVLVNANDSIACTKWFDNKPVVLLSTMYGNEPLDECRRWCKTLREYITIKRPMVIKMYNSKMGGVDMADRMLAVCPSRARTKKWTIRFISHMIDLAASNSWIQYRNTETQKGTATKKIQSLRQWKMALAESMLENINNELGSSSDEETTEPIRKRGRPSVNIIPSKTSRLREASHMPIFTGVMNRCRKEGCSKRSSAKCTTCGVVLCLSSARNCYTEFHK